MSAPNDATRLLDALGVDTWPFPAVSALFDLLCQLEIALVKRRHSEFVRAELRPTDQLELPIPPWDGPFDDADIPF